MRVLKFQGNPARQNAKHQAIMITARASEVLSFASIARAGRDVDGALQGFQRPQIASHIEEIREYLRTDNAVLPNCIVVGFVKGIEIHARSDGCVDVSIEVDGEPAGIVIDGQQRLIALAGLPEKDFQLFVSLLVCADDEELRRQFVLLNSTRPLPKALIYELLPGTAGLPSRYSSRSFAADLTERLNFDASSSLFGLIYLHTNPGGIIRDTSMQTVIMRSHSDGAIRELPQSEQLAGGFRLLSEFYGAVRSVFTQDWEGHTPETSRLIQGVGIQALGYVMELLVGREGAQTHDEFAQGLSVLRGHTAWTSGSWQFSESERVPWDKLENTSRQVSRLAQHLVSVARRELSREFKLVIVPRIS